MKSNIKFFIFFFINLVFRKIYNYNGTNNDVNSKYLFMSHKSTVDSNIPEFNLGNNKQVRILVYEWKDYYRLLNYFNNIANN